MTNQEAQPAAAELDKTRRYLVPVARLRLPDEPDLVHLSVYRWLPMFEAWATGPALCGRSASQGALPENTAVTCGRCLEWKPEYERMLAPGYHPEGDDVKTLRARIDRARALHRPQDDWSWGAFGCAHEGQHTQLCRTCNVCSPCPTAQALDGVQ